MNKEFLLFENDLRQALAAPNASPEFVDRLKQHLKQVATSVVPRSQRVRKLKPAWVVAVCIIFVLAAGILLIGPEKVYAEVLKLLGYIPGIGIVDQSQPVRVLSESVRVTRDGVTVSVNQALLTTEKTQLDYGFSGVPLSAYPRQEAVSGCVEQEYILLPDGTKIAKDDPIPLDVDQATFVIPCLFNTLPDTVPTDWEIPLTFIPLPPDTTVLPVQESTPDATIPAGTPGVAIPSSIQIDEIIQTEDGYILIGWFHANLPDTEQLQLTSVTYTDANGDLIDTSYPEDIDLSSSEEPVGLYDFPWAIKFSSKDIAFPITMHYSGKIYTKVDLAAPLEFEFDAGDEPQEGREWEINHDFDLDGSNFRLVSIRSTTGRTYGGYSLTFESDEEVSFSMQVKDHPAIGGGGGPYSRSMEFEEVPTGKMVFQFDDFYKLSGTRDWEEQWQPDMLPTPQAEDQQETSACLDSDSYQELPVWPDAQNGRIVLTQLNPQTQMVLQSTDGKETLFTILRPTRGILNSDGTKLAYPSDDGIVIVDLATLQESLLPNSGGYDLHWSPDDRYIAALNQGSDYGIGITALDGSGSKQLTNLGYESIAGWSPDGNLLYYAMPDAGDKGFMLKAVNVNTGSVHDLFILDDSSRKAPYPAVSPDGLWVAYRGRDNSSLYIKGMDGSSAKLLLDKPADAISRIVWERGSHWLGVSLLTGQNSDGEIILMQFENCEIYKLPELHGELDGIFIPQ